MCPVCKEGVPNRQAFSEHVLQCASVRYSCKTCGVTFKKLAYLKQHEKRQHNSGGQDEKSNTSAIEPKDVQPKNDESDTESSENSDWDNDPEIQFEDQIQHEEKGDERKVNDITTGRIYRKRTNPLPVSAPNESKVSATVTSAERCVTSADMEEKDSTMEERAQDNFVLLESSKEQEGSSATKAYEKEQVLEVEFSVDVDEPVKTKQKLRMQLDKEELISSTFVSPVKGKLGEMDINLGDYLLSETVKPENINIRMEKGKLSITVKSQ